MIKEEVFRVDKETGDMIPMGLSSNDVERLMKTAGKRLTRNIIAKGKKERGEYVSNGYLMQFKNHMHKELELSVGERYVWFVVKNLIRNHHEFVYLSNTWVANCINKCFDKKYTDSNISKYITGLCEKEFLLSVDNTPKLYMFNLHICHLEKQHKLWVRYQKYDFFDKKGIVEYDLIKDMNVYFSNEIGKSSFDVREECKEFAYITLTNTIPRSLKGKVKNEKQKEESDKKPNMFRYY
jgi:hypothetical protein